MWPSLPLVRLAARRAIRAPAAARSAAAAGVVWGTMRGLLAGGRRRSCSWVRGSSGSVVRAAGREEVARRVGGRAGDQAGGDTCSGARSRSASCRHVRARREGRSQAPRSPTPCAGVVEREHGALEAGRADLDAEEVQQVLSARQVATSASGLPLISSVRSEALAWLMRAAAAGEGDVGRRCRRRMPSISVIRSPHSGLAPS